MRGMSSSAKQVTPSLASWRTRSGWPSGSAMQTSIVPLARVLGGTPIATTIGAPNASSRVTILPPLAS